MVKTALGFSLSVFSCLLSPQPNLLASLVEVNEPGAYQSPDEDIDNFIL